MISGAWEGFRFAFVNTHLHSLPTPAGADRRHSEIKTLLEWLNREAEGADVVVIAGDFNAEADAPEMQILHKKGFDLISEKIHKKRFMLAILSPKITYNASLKIKNILEEVAIKIKTNKDWNIQEY